MAAFVAEQIDLLDSLLLEFAEGHLDRTELLLFLLAVEDDAKRRMLHPIRAIDHFFLHCGLVAGVGWSLIPGLLSFKN